jgi:hypothetical protein
VRLNRCLGFVFQAEQFKPNHMDIVQHMVEIWDKNLDKYIYIYINNEYKYKIIVIHNNNETREDFYWESKYLHYNN